jgi:4-carboxymuconolactone decarboxylase
MSTPIYLAAIVARDGRLWLVQEQPGGPWALPGGPLLVEHEDVDAGMEQILAGMGVIAAAVANDFIETLHLPADDGFSVYNLYGLGAWEGEPQAPGAHETAWFALADVAGLDIDPAVRQAVLAAIGLAGPEDEQERIVRDLQRFVAAMGGGQPPAPFASKREAGLDVLGTLNASDPAASYARLRARTPELADDVVDALGGFWAVPALDRKTRSLQVVAMLAALGRTGPLKTHFAGALNHGASPEQLIESIRMVAVYAGFPAALEAWPVMEAVFAERGIPRPRPTP